MTLALCATTIFPSFAKCADDNQKPGWLEKACLDAVKKWETTSGFRFDIPFPRKKYDIDKPLKQPIAMVTVKDQEAYCTRPSVHGEGDTYYISSIIFRADLDALLSHNLEWELHFDEKDGLVSVNLMSSPDDWTRQDVYTQIDRKDGETTAAYAERVVTTYQSRAKGAPNSVEAACFLAVWEKMFKGIVANHQKPAR